MYGTGWRGVPTKGEFFVFGFVVVLFVVLVVLACFGASIPLFSQAPSSVPYRCRPRGDRGSRGGGGSEPEVGIAEDRAERCPNMRNKSSTFRYWGCISCI